jgi:uncharacterized protein YkwD
MPTLSKGSWVVSCMCEHPTLSKRGWGMKRKAGTAILALLLASTASFGVEAAGGSVMRTTASNSSTAAHTGHEASSSATSRHAPTTAERATVGSSCTGADVLPTRSNLIFVDDATTCLINRERARDGLGELQPNRNLQKVAIEQAAEMVIGDYFGDDSMSGMTPIQRIAVTRYAWRVRSLSIGQNIGWGTGTMATPRAMVEGWMNSPPHRQIILTPAYRNIGAGIASSAPPTLAGGMPGATYSVELAARH